MIEIVAEISCNHNKSINVLDELLDDLLPSEEVTCIKLQAFKANSCTSKDRQFSLDRGPWSGRILHDLMLEAETPVSLINHAAARIRENNKKLMLSINSWDDFELISSLCPDYIKLPSPESLDVSLAKKVLLNCHNLVISTGVMSNLELEYIASQLSPLINSTNSLTILHCVSEYPTDFSNVNLFRLKNIKSLAPLALIGISDHSPGDQVPLLALGYGITMIEKHVMPSSKNFLSLDSSFSMTTVEFLEMARKISLSLTIIGSEKKQQPSHSQVLDQFWQSRISAHASHALKAGTIISTDDVVMLRPGDGLSPLAMHKYFGKKLLKSIRSGYPLSESDFLNE